jgi:hypothetical protein
MLAPKARKRLIELWPLWVAPEETAQEQRERLIAYQRLQWLSNLGQ